MRVKIYGPAPWSEGANELVVRLKKMQDSLGITVDGIPGVETISAFLAEIARLRLALKRVSNERDALKAELAQCRQPDDPGPVKPKPGRRIPWGALALFASAALIGAALFAFGGGS